MRGWWWWWSSRSEGTSADTRASAVIGLPRAPDTASGMPFAALSRMLRCSVANVMPTHPKACRSRVAAFHALHRTPKRSPACSLANSPRPCEEPQPPRRASWPLACGTGTCLQTTTSPAWPCRGLPQDACCSGFELPILPLLPILPGLAWPICPATASVFQDAVTPPINRARLASDRVVPSLELALPLDTSTRPQQLTAASPAGFLVHLGHLSRKQYPLGRNCLIFALKLAAAVLFRPTDARPAHSQARPPVTHH